MGGGGGGAIEEKDIYPQGTCILFMLGTLHKLDFFKPNCINGVIFSAAWFLQIRSDIYIHLTLIVTIWVYL